MEGAASQRGQTFFHQLSTAVNGSGQFGPILQGTGRDARDVRFVVLTNIGGVTTRNRTFRTHPGDRHRSVETSRKCDTDALADRK